MAKPGLSHKRLHRINGGTPSVLPRPDFHFPGEVGRSHLDSDPAQFPQPVQAPEGAPNILLILNDDCGFGEFSTFGGGIASPTMDRLAAEGLRYNHFHTTALCSPTRAALITGRNHHLAAFAGVTEIATGCDGYTCIPRVSSAVLLGTFSRDRFRTVLQPSGRGAK
jgi:arylsulfatase